MSAASACRADGAHNLDRLVEFLSRSSRLAVLTGAGCSTGSGIPDYRDGDGAWKHRRPVQFRDFLDCEAVRQRYWARSLVGWRRISTAVPNDAHRALARLEEAGRVGSLITQNVDGLHQKAGSRRVIDLHGRIDRVACLSCGAGTGRGELQARLSAANAGFAHEEAAIAPDGDAMLEDADFAGFQVPGCDRCGGLLKPDVVFFGEGVPRERVSACADQLSRSDALLVIGSSLMVWSGFRFVRMARERGMPVAAVNIGVTRADELLNLKVARDCGEVLTRLADAAR